MIIRKLNSGLLQRKPYEAWNAFVNLLATEDYKDLDEVQRTAHLCFWYDSEVQNGGHLQYFENRGTSLLNETLAALRLLGAESQRSVLEAAALAFSGTRRERINTVEEYVLVALRAEFAASDSAYYACSPPIQKLLADYFEKNKSHFVEITDSR
jgi:Domain of unknown function (DUF4375)